ncbi:MAG: PaaI family thioesterase [Methyloligellaceae bacterium]
MTTIDALNEMAKGYLPDHLGIEFTEYEGVHLAGRMVVKKNLMAPNGFLHGGSVVAFADTLAGIACVNNLPEGAAGFTTVELKTNFLGTAREGTVCGTAKPLHMGSTTQVWDVEIYREADKKVIAQFRCTQMILMPR